MATYKFDKIEYNGNTYVVSDSGALPLTGGQVTGPVTFGDAVSIDEATVGDLVVNGSASFTNNIQANTINGDLTGDVTGNVVGNVSGSAGTAGAFTSAKSVTLTGDVTGSASSTGGWSIATTVKDDSHNHTADTIMVPKITKSYTGVIASANNHDNAALYCIKIVPDSYTGQWYLKYRVFANMDGVSDANGHGYEESYVYINGMRNTYASYRTWNNVSNTSYRPYYYHSIYRAKQAGATTYGHVMGINLYSSYNPTNTTYKRNVTFEILDYGGCTISFFDAPTKYASIPGTGSTNYDGRSDFDGTTQGNTMSGDRNTTTTYGTIDYYFRPYAGQALYRYKYVMQGEDNRVYPITITNQTDSTQVAKVPTTVGLRPWKIWFYNSTTTINAGAVIGGQTLQETGYTTAAVYNFNANIPTYQMVYLKGTYNATKDLFYLYNNGSSPCTSYYTLVPDNTANITLSNYFAEGYYYVLLGASYSSANYVTLFGNHPLYYFDGTNLKEVNRIAPDWDESDSTSPSYIENRTHYRTSLGYNRTIVCNDFDGYWTNPSWTFAKNNITYPYEFEHYGIVDSNGMDIKNEVIPNINVSPISASITVNGATTNYSSFSVDKGFNDDYGSTVLYYYNNDIIIIFFINDDENETLSNGSTFIRLKTLPVDSDDEAVVISNLTITIPTTNEQFIYTKKLDSRYLDGKLIIPGTGSDSEIFNNISYNKASGSYSHAEGSNTKASSYNSHAEGGSTVASGSNSHAEGSHTIAYGNNSHAEGEYTRAYGSCSHAEGSGWADQINVTLTGDANVYTYNVTNTPTLSYNQRMRISTAEIVFYDENDEEIIARVTSTNYTNGNKLTSITFNKSLSSTAITNQSYYIMFRSIVGISGRYAHVEGYGCFADNDASHAEGYTTISSHRGSHSEGEETIASGQASHAEGDSTIASGSRSHAEGLGTSASSQGAHAEGYYTIADGIGSHSEGNFTKASGAYSHAEGYYTYSLNNSSHSEGGYYHGTYTINYVYLTGEANATTYSINGLYIDNTSIPLSSEYAKNLTGFFIGGTDEAHRVISTTISDGKLSSVTLNNTLGTSSLNNLKFTIYLGTYALGIGSHTEGFATIAKGQDSHAEGSTTIASVYYGHAEGYRATASGQEAHAEGNYTIASGQASHAEGSETVADGLISHAEGNFTRACEQASHAEGYYSIANAKGAHAEGGYSTGSTNNNYLYLTGDANATTYTVNSMKIGDSVTNAPNLVGFRFQTADKQKIISQTTSGGVVTSITVDKTLSSSTVSNSKYKLCFGTVASGISSHSEGVLTSSNGYASHAEGFATFASKDYSHAEGYGSIASNRYAHAEGQSTTASEYSSHSEGYSTVASGTSSHAEGSLTVASGSYSHSEGSHTTAQRRSQHVFGEYNVLDTYGADTLAKGQYIEIVGKGTSSSARSNARTLDWSGNETLAGSITLGKGTSDEVTLTPAKLKQLLALL